MIEFRLSGSTPPDAFATRVIVISLTPSIVDGAEKDDAPFDTVLFVTTYSSITMFPSDKLLSQHHHQSKLQNDHQLLVNNKLYLLMIVALCLSLV